MRLIVSGPEGERRSPAPGPALSLAITLANRLARPGSIYVRNLSNGCLYRVDRDEARIVTVHRGEAS